MIGGGDNIESAKTFKDKTAKILDGAGFKLHKWHFSVAEMKEELKIETGEQGKCKDKNRWNFLEQASRSVKSKLPTV